MSGWAPLTEEDEALAAEYVLGLLDRAELAAFEARLGTEAELRRAVARWAEDFAAMTDDIPAIAPPRAIEARLHRELFPEARPQGGLLWRMLPWALGAVAAGVVAFVALDLTVLGRPDYELASRMVSEDPPVVVEARFDRDTNRLLLQRVSGEIPEGRDLELWLVRVEPGTTVSLGVIPHDPEGVIEVSADLAAELPDNALALSVEPPGGSPTGQATGPVIAVGPLTGL